MAGSVTLSEVAAAAGVSVATASRALSGKNRVAVFFANNGLHKGTYQLDQWIRVGKTEDFASTCPLPVNPVGAVKLAPLTTAH